MTTSNRTKAIEIISASNSVKVSFNVPVKNNYSNTHDILIHECNADLVNKLKDAGFSLSMGKKGMSVSKYS